MRVVLVPPVDATTSLDGELRHRLAETDGAQHGALREDDVGLTGLRGGGEVEGGGAGFFEYVAATLSEHDRVDEVASAGQTIGQRQDVAPTRRDSSSGFDAHHVVSTDQWRERVDETGDRKVDLCLIDEGANEG